MLLFDADRERILEARLAHPYACIAAPGEGRGHRVRRRWPGIIPVRCRARRSSTWTRVSVSRGTGLRRAGASRPLLLAVHGSDRDYRGTLAAFASLADRRDVSILAPLFPAGAVNAGVDGGYKFLREAGADYILLLDAMLAAFSKVASFDAQQLYLFGFSGGGQFALRYGLVAASQLAGLIIAAPGNVTLLDDALPGGRGPAAWRKRPAARSTWPGSATFPCISSSAATT